MRTRTSIFFSLLLTAAPGLWGQTPTIEDKIRGMTKLGGYFPLYWDDHAGPLWLEIPRFDTDFLNITGLAAGLGSNDIGLDRGQAGESAIGYFQRIGPKVFLVLPGGRGKQQACAGGRYRAICQRWIRCFANHARR